MIFFTALNDVIADPKDVQQLIDILKVKPLHHYMISDPSFGHSTWIFGEQKMIVPYVIQPVLDVMSAFYPQ